MNNEYDKIDYWIETSQYDFETAKAMLKTKRFLYVAYMCNLSIEKILKAYYVYSKKQMPPYVHKLRRIATEGNLYKFMSSEQKDFIDTISSFNIECRYPEQKRLLYETLNNEECTKLIEKTEELIEWIKKKLEN